MESLFNYVSGVIGIIASLLGIYQFLSNRDKSQQIRELENRNSYLSHKIIELHSGNSTDLAESTDALDHDRQRLHFKHMTHSYDQLRRRVFWGVTALSAISYVIMLSIIGDDYVPVGIFHVLAIPVVGLFVHVPVRHLTLRKLHSLYAEASYHGDNDMTELQNWIGTQPWRQKSTATTLNKAVMKWSSSK